MPHLNANLDTPSGIFDAKYLSAELRRQWRRSLTHMISAATEQLRILDAHEAEEERVSAAMREQARETIPDLIAEARRLDYRARGLKAAETRRRNRAKGIPPRRRSAA